MGEFRFGNQVGLVLEGGGMRGVFTSGVLDYLMDNKVQFPYVIGVSAGACNGLSYISNQRGRARTSNIELLEEYDYISIKHLFSKRNILDSDLLFYEFPEHIVPFDYDTYFSSPMRFVMVTTNCLTGEANYLEDKKSKERVIDIVKASSSLPFVSPITYVDEVPMLDGGIVDSIPLAHAIQEGYTKNLVVLTRPKGYRKETKDIKVPSFIYRKYPKLREALSSRCAAYNAQLDLVDEYEEKGLIMTIRPQQPVEVDRLEKDVKKLETLYEEGYKCASKVLKREFVH
ncbi:MAG: patatin family protein [Bacteroides sp.]|nr:patatin family protein [Bacteroides sp.]MDD2644642.1 patatin family protein [Bacteroides sp.]MDD4054934.1 patatin family protein [Bacteroides sp.]MDD4719363.1 patatin family protein [Bacteroides sp.]NLI63917.1 patatin family protein [Bacteroidales bacterium]